MSNHSNLNPDAADFAFSSDAASFEPSALLHSKPAPDPTVHLYFYEQVGQFYDYGSETYYSPEDVRNHDPFKLMYFCRGNWLTQPEYQQVTLYSQSFPSLSSQFQPSFHDPSLQVQKAQPAQPVEEEPEFIGMDDYLNMNKEQRAQIESKARQAEVKPKTRGGQPKKVPRTQKEPKKEVRKEPKAPKPEVVHKQIDKQKLLQKAQATSERTVREPDTNRAPVNLVFIGHVDAGKSTICGNVLVQTGMIDRRVVDQYIEEAKAKGRDSWWLAYVMDESEEERAKGKTIEVGRAFFSTPTKRFTILDAPGHQSYVPNMISGASQADFGALVVSARKGEFETGFDRGGQTREHVLLAKALGVNTLVVVVNKMDDESVCWSEDRFNQIRSDLSEFLRNTCKFNLERDVFWVPISGLRGGNVLRSEEDPRAYWYEGPPLLHLLDMAPAPFRSSHAPLRIPIVDKTRDQGLIIYGKVESGKCVKGLKVTIMPLNVHGEVLEIIGPAEEEYLYADSGENVKLKLRVPDDCEIQRGFVICDIHDYCHVSNEFAATVDVLELLENKPIITPGYSCVIHMHTAVEECEVTELIALLDPVRKKKVPVKFGRSQQLLRLRLRVANPICVENYSDMPPLGRFALRDEGKTIGLGRVVEQVSRRAEEVVDDLGF